MAYYYYPRTPQSFFYPSTTRFYQPPFPCSYFHNNNNINPFYSHPYYSSQNHSFYDEPEDRQKSATNFTTNLPPKKSFRVKISGGEEEEKKFALKKSRAAHKIVHFIKHQKEKKQIRQILNKLHELRNIENELKEIHQNNTDFGNLTFNKEHERQVLPISVENKRFLEYEYKITKLFDKLDRIQSGGVDIIRERRKSIVKSTQTLLEELDNEKENQWKSFNEKQDVIMNDAFEEDGEGSKVNEEETNEKVNEPSREEDETLEQANEIVNDDERLEPMEIVPVSSESVEQVLIESNSSLPDIGESSNEDSELQDKMSEEDISKFPSNDLEINDCKKEDVNEQEEETNEVIIPISSESNIDKYETLHRI